MPNDRRDALFEQALALSPSARAAFLTQACADDGELRAEVASLLEAHDAADGFFEALARDATQPLQQSLGHLGMGADDEPLAIGDMVAHYRVDARLGRGGMGVVYTATDTRLGRTVALKVLPASHTTDARAQTRLLEEARAASALEHPHIGTIFDVGTLNGGVGADRMYIAMAYYDGETLADRLARGPVPLAESLRIGRELASALDAAHRAGLVHRDVKPSNVLLTAVGGSVRLVDFGIAARTGSELPQTTAARGTRRYMSPERASGAPPDPRADVWSLGLVLRDLIDARPEPAHLPIPDALADLLHRCLDPDPMRRPATAGEVLLALDGIEPITQTPLMRHTARWTVAVVGLSMAAFGWLLLPRGTSTLESDAPITPNRVLVLPFEDQSADSALASFGALAADHVAEAIAATSFAEAVPPFTAYAIARDGTPVPDGMDLLVHMARPTGAAYVLAGSYRVQGDSLVVRAALSSGRDGRMVRTLQTVSTTRTRPGDALAALARAAVVGVAVELDPRVRTDPMVPALPPNWDAYQAYARAKEHFLARRYDEAVTSFNEAYARDSSFRFPLFYQGMVYVNTRRWDRLETVIDELRRRQTPATDPVERLAVRVLEAFRSGDFATVYRVHREAEAIGMIGPGGLGHFSMGAVALEVGRPREAIRIIRQSDPTRGELKGWSSYYQVLAIAHLWLGEYDAALDAVRRLQADHPGLDVGAQLAMRTFAMQGRAFAVDSVLEAALLTTADPGGMLRYAGDVLQLAGRDGGDQYARAVRYEREQLRRAAGATTPEARLALGESLLLAGELDEAETIARGLMAEQPALMDPLTSVGRIAARRGDAVAVAEIDRLLAERATERWNLGQATYRRARLAAAQRDGARAARLLEQAWQEGFSIYADLWTDAEFAAVLSHPAMRTLLAPRG
jgi:tetratricopeptide (TPR) repeat protein/TolB-like protein